METERMCLAIPARVVQRQGPTARVDFGDGTTRKVNVSLVNVKVGEYVIVHAGFAIQVMDEREASDALRLWSELLSPDVQGGNAER